MTRIDASSLACFLMLTGCVNPDESSLQRFEFAEPHMGAMFNLVLYAPDRDTAKRAATVAFARVADLNRIMTDYDPESELMRLGRGQVGTPVRVSPELFEVLKRSNEVARMSQGAFDVTIGEQVQLWRRARRQRELPDPARLTQAREASGWEHVVLDESGRTVTLQKPGMRLDLGGIAKGFAADAALKVLREAGIRRALVAASGDIVVGDPPPGRTGWNVGVASVDALGSNLTTTLNLARAAVSTSGDTEQFVEIDGVRYSHIVDPRTGVGLTKRLGVTVVAPDGTTSDSLATAVSVLGVEEGLKLIETQSGTAALIVSLDGERKRVDSSSRFRRFQTGKPPVRD